MASLQDGWDTWGNVDVWWRSISEYRLHTLIVNVWESEEVPKESICDNYRCISLLNVAGKVFSWVIMMPVLDEITLESQCGFHKNRSCTDMSFVARQLRKRAWNSKGRSILPSLI